MTLALILGFYIGLSLACAGALWACACMSRGEL